MNSAFRIESGIQLLARLTRRPSLTSLWSSLLPSTLPAGAVLEVSGASGAGKSLLAADAVCRALLPSEYGGCGAGVVIYSTDGNLNVTWLLNSLRERIGNAIIDEESSSKLENAEKIMEEVQQNLLIADIYDSMQLLISIENLEMILTDNPNISLIVVDTLTAFYWSDQGPKLQRMDSYLKNLIRKIQRITKDHKVTILYTKPQYFGSKQDGLENVEACVKAPTLERVNFRIQVSKNDDSKERYTFQVDISSSDETMSHYFKINKNLLIWLT